MHISYLQKLLSFFYPVKISEAQGISTPIIGLYKFQGRWQLSAATAIYSDGAAYAPLKLAFNFLKNELHQKQKMLVLGAGLGSAVSVMHNLNISLENTLVEIDPQIIAWGKPILEAETKQNCTWVCSDVLQFVERESNTYDLIVLDVFQDRVVPHFISTTSFLSHCKRMLQNHKSVLVFNYIINNETQWADTLENVKTIFKIDHIIAKGINRIMILRNIA